MPRPVTTVAALAAVALATVTAVATTTTATAAPSTGAGSAARQQGFTAAAAEFGVPATVLEAVSYAQTRWEGHPGEHNTSGGYGPMNLVDATLLTANVAQERGEAGAAAAVPSSVDTLGRAAKLLGVDRDALRRDPAMNIRGAPPC